MCSILSDLITSTMKSELGLPARCGISFGTAVSLAICCTLGGTAAGSRFESAAVVPGVAALATLVDAAAPATAAPARNLRRLTSGWERLRAMVSSNCRAAAKAGAGLLSLRKRTRPAGAVLLNVARSRANSKMGASYEWNGRHPFVDAVPPHKRSARPWGRADERFSASRLLGEQRDRLIVGRLRDRRQIGLDVRHGLVRQHSLPLRRHRAIAVADEGRHRFERQRIRRKLRAADGRTLPHGPVTLPAAVLHEVLLALDAIARRQRGA